MTNPSSTHGSVVIVGATSKWNAHGWERDEVEGEPGLNLGLGAALAEAYAQAGYKVFVTSRELSRAESLARELSRDDNAVSGLGLDVTDEDSVHEAFDHVTAQGPVNTVIYNVGHSAGRELSAAEGAFDTFPTSLFETTVQSSVIGPFFVARKALSVLSAQGSGTFLMTNNVQSLRGRQRQQGESLYYLRGSMRHLTQALAEEYAPRGVQVVNVVIDGLIESAATRALAGDHTSLLDARGLASTYVSLSERGSEIWMPEVHLYHAGRPPSY